MRQGSGQIVGKLFPMYCRHFLERAVLLQVLAQGTLITAFNLCSLLLCVASILDGTTTLFYFDEGHFWTSRYYL